MLVPTTSKMIYFDIFFFTKEIFQVALLWVGGDYDFWGGEVKKCPVFSVTTNNRETIHFRFYVVVGCKGGMDSDVK